MKNKIDINNYGNLVNEKKLGEFTYQDVKNKPIGVTGFLQNGTGYGIYIEYCYFSSSGNYKSFIFANLPYGLGEFEVIEESDYLSQFEKPDEIKFDLSTTHLKRDNSFPSTFGIYDTEISDEDIIDILTTWHKIDYNSLIIDIENDY